MSKPKFDEPKLVRMFLRMFKCSAVRLVNPLGVQMFLIIGMKRHTKNDLGQWYKNGKPFDFSYIAEKVIASGITQAQLIASAKEYRRLEAISSRRASRTGRGR